MTRSIPLTAVLTAVLVGTGCTTVKVDLPPAGTTVPATFDAMARVDTVATDPAAIDRWWTAWNDPALSGLIEQALQDGADVRVALARVKEARQVVTMAESALYPQLALSGAAGHDRLEVRPPPLPGPVPVSPGTLSAPVGSLNTVGPTLAWEVDVFGLRRSDADAARQAALPAEDRLKGARMLVAGDVATNYIDARAIDRRLDVLDRAVDTARRGLRYAQGRFDAGQATRADVDRARSAVETSEAARAPLQALQESRLRRLAVLTGRNPQSLNAAAWRALAVPADTAPQHPAPLPRGAVLPAGLPDTLPAALPSEVLERRPDVQGAVHAVRAQAAKLGSARAELLPRFTFAFLMQDGHIGLSGLPSLGGNVQVWGVGVNLPLFTGGRLRAQVKAQDARLEAALVQYEQALQSALEDVENAYAARWALDQRRARLSEAARLADDAARHAEALFAGGQTLLQNALDARAAALQREDELIQAEAARATLTVRLYQAIGGGTAAPATASPSASGR